MKMPRASPLLFDTRFFVEHFFSSHKETLKLTTREIEKPKAEKIVSVIVLHEFYRLNLERQGRDVAKLRTTMIKDSFRIVDVDSSISIEGAELRKKYSIPMADSLIAATAKVLNAVCVTDDPHLREIKEIRSRWLA